MADDPVFFRNRAEIERARADAATLDNVREGARRAQFAWEAMADRAERTKAQRLAREGASSTVPAVAGG